MEDVIIIGGGICGCSLLYELSRYKLKVLLLEKENDVACGTSKANSAIVHAGYDPEPDTSMARFNVEGNILIERLCRDLDIMYKKTGSLVVGFGEEDRRSIEKLLEKGNKNRVPDLRIIEGEELFRLEPNLSREASCALYAPSAGIVCPWELASAQAECAVRGGAKVELDCEVRGIKKEGGGFTVTSGRGNYQSRFVVNAAGVDSDTVSRMVEPEFFAITPKSGEYFILDTTESNLVNTVVFPCPSKLGKGVLVAPTVHGNIIVGPDSKDFKRGDYATTAVGLEYVRRNALRSIPSINFRASIRNFSGLRADAGLEDFIVGESREAPGFFNIAAVKSPGLTSSPSIAREIAGQLNRSGLAFEPNPQFQAKRRVKRFRDMNEEERRAAIRENPLYGNIVCRCETVTEGEIIDALERPLPPRSLDALKRRCAPGMGRCQGGFCGSRVLALIARHFNLKPEDVPKDRRGMYIITGETKKGGAP
ncbi:MAG: NAD(P)/FAD-dependent oxidoreductase [Treponema sp.]|jgi:glycerol-3-phosphate dehydrogenase|nr:NAD(P)/FAD-dependent oxidoreductase [Treponema sp.]